MVAIVEHSDLHIGRDDAHDGHWLRAGFRAWPKSVCFGENEVQQRPEMLDVARMAPAGQAVQERIYGAFNDGGISAGHNGQRAPDARMGLPALPSKARWR